MPSQRVPQVALLEILRCPETLQTLSTADPTTVAAIEAARVAGTLRNREGELASGPVTAGLVREDGQAFYPVRDGIPVMLVGESIALPLAVN